TLLSDTAPLHERHGAPVTGPASGSWPGHIQRGRLRVQPLECLAAGLLTALARLGTNTAVLVHVGVVRAFAATRRTGGAARLDEGSYGRSVGFDLTAEYRRGGLAQVGAVQVETDAAAELGDHVFGEASVGAHVACLRTLFEVMEDLGEGVGGQCPGGGWMGFEHCLGVGHSYSSCRVR